MTIDCNVPIELDVNAMKVGEPDVEALRALFTELEFTSLLKELLPVVEVSEAHYTEAKSAADVEAVLKAVLIGRRAGGRGGSRIRSCRRGELKRKNREVACWR